MDRACVRQAHRREPSGLCITISKAHTQQRLCRRRCMQFWCLQARIWHRTCASPGVWGQWSSGCWNLFELLEQAAQENLACVCLHKVFKCRLPLQPRSAYLGHWMYSRLAFRAQYLRRKIIFWQPEFLVPNFQARSGFNRTIWEDCIEKSVAATGIFPTHLES